MQSYITSIVIIFLLCSIQTGFSEQGNPAEPKSDSETVAAVSAERARIKFTKGTVAKVIDFEKDISGCLDLYESLSNQTIQPSAIGLKVIDSVVKNNTNYVLLLVSAESNCNVTGWCGAASDYTVIWLQLDNSLRVRGKKIAVIVQCKSNIFTLKPDPNESAFETRLKLVDGKFEIDYGKELYKPETHRYYRLFYDSNYPERGITITRRTR